MLERIEVRNEQEATLDFFLRDPTSGYLITKVTGLDPVKSTMVSSTFAGVDGESFQASRRDKRNIVISLDIKQEYTISSTRLLRKKLYELFPVGKEIRLKFFLDDLEDSMQIYGYVESLNTDHFSEQSNVTISIVCHDPDFYNPNEFVVSGMTTPYDTEMAVEYDGDVETGYVLRLAIDRSLPAITIHHRPGDGTVRDLAFAVATPLIAGDVLKISTVTGDKGATRLRGADWKSVLYGVSPDSEWVKLFPGTNKIRVSSGGAPIPYTITFTSKFGGL